ncbi:MAG: hypothetical protein NVS2B4_01090 [Ramlibacter sp.]
MLVFAAMQVGCGSNVPSSTSASANRVRSAPVAAVHATASSSEIATTFGNEKAGAAAAQMYPSL